MNDKAMTLYAAKCRGNKENTRYPYKVIVTRADDLKKVAKCDHVCAEYTDNQRSKDNFQKADNSPFDVDNDHSDNPADWKTPEEIRALFPRVPLYIVLSRHHMKVKNGKSARPRFHCYLLTGIITDRAEYERIKQQAFAICPYFDDNALDAGRFLYGVKDAQAEFYDGDITLKEFLAAHPVAEPATAATPAAAPGDVIPEGQRNSTLSRFALCVLKKYGVDDGKAQQAFAEESAKCSPPLDGRELQTIWNSAMKCYREKVQTNPAYVPPAEYAVQDFAENLIPDHLTDVGQSKKLAELYHGQLRYSDATLWLSYDGRRWQENSAAARGYVHDLTDRQMKQAHRLVTTAQDAMLTAQEQQDNGAAESAKSDLNFAQTFHKFAREYQKSSRISATLTEATPYLQIDVEQLDADAFLLNTPAGTVDLHDSSIRSHNPEDFCTKITGCAPGSDGMELFREFLDRITCGDKEQQDYLQMIAGMFAVGAVYRECLIIAYGGGGNGKSTLFNLLAMVMGDYAGNLSAETLTANCRKNKSPEYAEMRGKRLVIAAELEEGMRFDTAIIKKLCSTDKVQAEKKFKAPFSFTPSHTLVLYTNHLPKVGTTDKGTWDRLIVVPFTANLRGQRGEILNYAQHLYDHAGGAVLSWMIEGARRFIAAQYKIELPACVQAAIQNYREDNDWLTGFLDECCEKGANFKARSGDLYQAYRNHCLHTGDYTRSAADFKRAVEVDSDLTFRKSKDGMYCYGLRVRGDDPFPQPLTA